MKRILFFIFAAFAALCICSCGDDSADDAVSSGGNGFSGGANSNSSIVGTWLDSGGYDAYVFRADGTGIGCEHVSETQQDEWTFTYTLSNDGTLTMVYDDDVEYEGEGRDVFKNVVIKNGELTYQYEDDDRYTLMKQTNPIFVLSVKTDYSEKLRYEGDTNTCFVNKNWGVYSLYITGFYLWHTDYSSTLTPSVVIKSDYNGMLSSCSIRSNGMLSLTVNSNTSTSERSAVITITMEDFIHKKHFATDIRITQK